MDWKKIERLKSRIEKLESKIEDSASRCINETFKYIHCLGGNDPNIMSIQDLPNISDDDFDIILEYIHELENSSLMTGMQKWLCISDLKLAHKEFEMLKRLLKEAQETLDQETTPPDTTNTSMSSDNSETEDTSPIYISIPGALRDTSIGSDH